MIRTLKIYMEMCRKSDLITNLSDDDLNELHAHLRKMYVDIEKMCSKHGLTVMLAYGSILGAIRHKGFIPWDDDMDLYMPREDYDKFMSIYYKELPENYIVYAPNRENGPIYYFAKVIDKNTSFVSPGQENCKHQKGVFVDVFPIENISNNRFYNIYKRIISLIIIYISSSVAQFEQKSALYKSVMSGSLMAKANYWLRHLLGFVFSFKSSADWYNAFDKFTQLKKATGYVHTPCVDESWEPIKREVYLPVKRVKFDDIEVNIPNNSIFLLERIYGDWKYIPSEQERKGHYVVNFSL